MSEVKVKFLVMKNGKDLVKELPKGGFDTYEAAEALCREKASKISSDLMGSAPYYEIKKVFTI